MCKKTNKITNVIMICNGSDCRKKGGKELYKTCRQKLKQLGRTQESLVVRTECTGLCKQAPVVCIEGRKILSEATSKRLRAGLELAFA